MKVLSCGIIIINSKNEILGCKPFGKHADGVDIPKGRIEENEIPLEAALRETREEAGINLDGIPMQDLGKFNYTKKKDLYLFKCRKDIDDLNLLNCTSYFEYKGEMRPEVDGYEWIPINEINNRFYKSLGPILTKILNNND